MQEKNELDNYFLISFGLVWFGYGYLMPNLSFYI